MARSSGELHHAWPLRAIEELSLASTKKMLGPTCVLIVADPTDESKELELRLQAILPHGVILQVDSEASCVRAFDELVPDLILSESRLRQLGAHDVLRLSRNWRESVPVIVISSGRDEESAAAYIRAGASDVIVRHHLERLGPAVDRVLALSQAQGEQRRAQEEVRASEARLRAILDASLDGVVTIDTSGSILGWNAQAEAMFGWSAEEVIGRPMAETIIPPAYREKHHRGVEHFLATGEGPVLNRRLTLEGLARDGRIIPIELTITSVRLADRWLFSAFIRDLTEQQRTADALKASELRLQQVVGRSAAIIYVIRVENDRYVPTWVSENITRVTGYEVDEALSPTWWIDRVHPEDRIHVQEELARLEHGEQFAAEYRFRTRDGQYRWILDEARLQRDGEGKPVELVGAWIDITARRTLEQQLHQARKMEAVGQLAGGIAHDFNNILTVITGNAELLIADMRAEDPGLSEAGEILSAATRAASLTRQLLAFSRQQVLQPTVLDLRDVVLGMNSMLRRIVGENIELVTTVADERGNVRADPGQIEQVILNLVVNARDAMPEGGRINIQIASATFDAAYTQTHPPAVPGEYVMLAVSDTGHGMSPEIQARMFEPFFTTKALGHGTGLGLATVYGIVKQSGGFIWIYSELEKGTTFKIYLPLVTEAAGRAAAPLPPVARGSETILLVEDDASVRQVAKGVLSHYGYRVLEAGLPEEALRMSAAHAGPIDLIVSDLVMPGMSGRELVKRLSVLRPGIKVLLVSGYAGVASDPARDIPADVAFLPKPFSSSSLSRKVRAVLDDAASQA